MGRGGRRAGATVVLAFGLTGVVAGSGIGVPWALAVGAATTTMAAVAALLAGLTLVVAGTADLLRGARRWCRALAVPVGLAVVAGLVLPLGVAVSMTSAPPLELGDATPADVGLAYDDVRLRTADGEQLAAWYVPSTNGSAVVLLAGSGSTRDDEIGHAAARRSSPAVR
jgi:uncharacterized protein